MASSPAHEREGQREIESSERSKRERGVRVRERE